MFLVQILGGLCGIGIAYIWYLYDEKKQARIDAELKKQHEAELEQLRINYKLGASK